MSEVIDLEDLDYDSIYRQEGDSEYLRASTPHSMLDGYVQRTTCDQSPRVSQQRQLFEHLTGEDIYMFVAKARFKGRSSIEPPESNSMN